MSDRGIAIVLATYNGARFLYEQLESLRTQTLLPIELIVLDDGSTDATMAILHQFAATAPFPCTIMESTERKGPVTNFMRLANLSTARYVAFCDQDDIWKPDKLSVCHDKLASSKAWLIAHTVSLIDDQGVEIGQWDQGIKIRKGRYLRCDPWSSFLGMSMVCDKSILGVFPGEPYMGLINPHRVDIGMSHDQWLDFVAESFSNIEVICENLASYRLHDSNLSGVKVDLASKRVQLKIAAGFKAIPERRLSAAAEQRAMLLDDVGPTMVPEMYARSAAATARWRRTARLERLRENIYAEHRFGARLKGLAQTFWQGGYRSADAGGIGFLTMVKDVIAVIVPHREEPSS